MQALAHHPRDYTAATVIVNGVTYSNVGVKLKGGVGSFRSVDDRPAMTLHFSKWEEGRRVFGLRRLHLNNSVQDETRMNEYIGSELFLAAGIPTPRVAWATVRLNDQELGLYVLKEAFESEFLKLYFGSDKGNLYEGGFMRDIDRDIVKESGKGPDDFSDLQKLRAAMNEKNPTNRWTELQKVLEVDKFVTYMALSTMLADWDGYPLNRNNYRIYFRPSDGRAVFMPHGMDQLFQRSIELDASWNGALAWAVFDTPQGQKLYQERCPQVFTNIFRLERMTNLISQATELLCKVKPKMTNWANDLNWSVQKRYRDVQRDSFLQPSPPVVTTNSP
jgi:spore coat protein H